MNIIEEQAVSIKNVNSPFTEIFSLLMKYEILSDNTLTLAYTSQELLILRVHAQNAVEVLLQGLQDIGRIMAILNSDSNYDLPVHGIGYLISATCNLIEALNGIIAS